VAAASRSRSAKSVPAPVPEDPPADPVIAKLIETQRFLTAKLRLDEKYLSSNAAALKNKSERSYAEISNLEDGAAQIKRRIEQAKKQLRGIEEQLARLMKLA
jgi:predicted RNase H-like nuclease (RuvC/YqgF family)